MDTDDFNFFEHGKILEEKRKLRSKIDGIKIDGAGKCVHVGKISPGCKGCFLPRSGESIGLGNKCNLNCHYCLSKVNRPVSEKNFTDKLAKIYRKSLQKNYQPDGFAFTNGEPLLYMDRMEKFAELFNQIESRNDQNIWLKLYTNGLLFTKEKFDKLEKWNIDEIRFHPSASNFSDTVYENMMEAEKRGFLVVVEEPAYPPHREALFEALPVFEEIGIKHMQLCEPKVYDRTIEDVIENYPGARFYFASRPFLYHEGLTYDIMEEVIDKNYSYSVLDCSAELWRLIGVKKSLGRPQSPPGIIKLEGIEDVFANYNR